MEEIFENEDDLEDWSIDEHFVEQMEQTAPEDEAPSTNDEIEALDRIRTWDMKNSEAYKQIHNHFYRCISHLELLRIAQIVSTTTYLTVSRLERRNFRLLYRWFQDHWNIVAPEIFNITAYDEDGNRISQDAMRDVD